MTPASDANFKHNYQNQLKQHVPAAYFLLTFTLPAELRPLAWLHQRKLYAAIMRRSCETVPTFSLNDKQLQGTPGAVTVLHTHSRRLDFHPHVHKDIFKRDWSLHH